MKKAKKILTLAVSLVMVPVMLMGCGSKEKIKPEESAKMMYNLAFKGEKQDLDKLGITQKQVDDILNTQKKAGIDMIKTAFTSGGLKVTDAQVEEVYKARCEALNKLTVTTETTKKDDKEATVKVSTTYFKELDLNQKAANDAIETVKALKPTSQQEALTKATDEYVKNLIAAYKNAKVESDTKSKEFKFVIKDKVWIADNSLDFGMQVGKLASGLE